MIIGTFCVDVVAEGPLIINEDGRGAINDVGVGATPEDDELLLLIINDVDAAGATPEEDDVLLLLLLLTINDVGAGATPEDDVLLLLLLLLTINDVGAGATPEDDVLLLLLLLLTINDVGAGATPEDDELLLLLLPLLLMADNVLLLCRDIRIYLHLRQDNELEFLLESQDAVPTSTFHPDNPLVAINQAYHYVCLDIVQRENLNLSTN